MINLDSREEINKIDKENMYSSVSKLGDQIWQAWNDIAKIKLPDSCSLATSVVIAGMGGSALGGRIIDSLIPERARTPIEVFTEYHLPNYVGKNTLVIASSYSGNTEEAVTDAKQAILKSAQLLIITTGGKLAELAKDKNIPAYIIDPRENPSQQPRMALGYSIGAILGVLARCEFVSISDEEIVQLVENIKRFTKELGIEKKDSLAKVLAKKLHQSIPVLVASEHLVGSAHAVKNQLNEGAKTFSTLFDIPELNHHLLEGLKNPAKAKELLKFLFIESFLYTPRVQKRYPITKKVVEENGVEVISYQTKGKDKLNQVFELLVLGSFVQFYLAMLYEIDPTPIPFVDYFKKEMAK